MKKLLVTTCLASLSAVSYAAPAPENDHFNYNFVEGQFVDLDADSGWDNDNADMDGLRIKGSVDVAPSFSIIGSVTDTGNGHFDLTVVTFGGAYHQSLAKLETMPLDLVLRAEVEHVEVDYDNRNLHWDDSETGVLLSGGLQLAIVDKLQAFGDVIISSNDYREMSLQVGARYAFVPALEGTASIELGDLDVLAIGLRYNF